jgi:hypothetical protein
MVKKSLEQKIDALTSIVENGFAASDKKFGALAEDIADLRQKMATKDDVADLQRELKGDIAGVQSQVNSIERQLRETKTEVRLGDLEEKVFGAPRR